MAIVDVFLMYGFDLGEAGGARVFLGSLQSAGGDHG